jgi:tetratricopeptide (TPR) repeat protein
VELDAIYGYLFILLMCAAIFWCRRRRETRPIAFGLLWFVVSCMPTSWIPLAEVENDHRLFFPFVGLAMGLCWAAALWLYRHPVPKVAVGAVCALLLASAAWGTHERNIVWHTDESLWLDVTRKSPGNGRGLMNYGLTQMRVGRYAVALDYYTRALVLDPYYSTLETNLGVVNGALHQNAEAEKHFLRAIQLAPSGANEREFYGRWLAENGRTQEAIADLQLTLRLKNDDIEARYILMDIYAKLGDRERLRALAAETLAMFPSDGTARAWLAKAPTLPPVAAPQAALAAGGAVPSTPTAEGYLDQSLVLFRAGNYAGSIAAAREALAIRPGYAEAWNNIMASYNAMSDWDKAIAAGEEAVKLDPTDLLARNNLALAKAQKKKSTASPK